ncbi:unnamed protein product [Peronospora destructor]|nr:unnamed protein product [Peronospora destructor]
MSRVLISIYQALVNTSLEHEVHSTRVFTNASATDKFSYHLRLPQEEQTFVPSNLPLPNFWMVCPLSRMDYSKSGDGNPPTSVGPTRAQSDEMKLIVSATCRFAFEFERLAPQMSSVSSITELRPEDKLFHVLHVFFAGSDVFFDDHVDAALRQLLPKLVQPILRSPQDSRVFYKGILLNLERIQNLESGRAAVPSPSQNAMSFLSGEQQVMTFVEKLVGEFTASSFGNSHFAQCVTLLMTRDFSLELRKFVWKELQESQLLHTLVPFEGCTSQLHKRCILGGTTTAVDFKLLQLMQEAVCKDQVSLARGTFAYSIAIHHLVVYLFAEGDNSTLSSARQLFAQTLVAEASPEIWRHLLSYDAFKTPSLITKKCETVMYERVAKLRTQAGFLSDQLLAFEVIVSSLEGSRATN